MTENPERPELPAMYSLLDEMMEIREEAKRGRPFWFFFGSERFEALVAYTEGFLACRHRSASPDKEWGAFMSWLRDQKGALPSGWMQKYVDECGGDHGRAMMKFLDFVAEFVALRRVQQET